MHVHCCIWAWFIPLCIECAVIQDWIEQLASSAPQWNSNQSVPARVLLHWWLGSRQTLFKYCFTLNVILYLLCHASKPETRCKELNQTPVCNWILFTILKSRKLLLMMMMQAKLNHALVWFHFSSSWTSLPSPYYWLSVLQHTRWHPILQPGKKMCSKYRSTSIFASYSSLIVTF